MTWYYIDTSVAADALLVDGRASEWLERVTTDPGNLLLSSRLLRTELTRVLRREKRPVSERDALLDHVATVPLTDAILTAAEAITEHVKTLDAIHLASALSLGSAAVVVSHDETMRRLARLLGLLVFDPITENPSP